MNKETQLKEEIEELNKKCEEAGYLKTPYNERLFKQGELKGIQEGKQIQKQDELSFLCEIARHHPVIFNCKECDKKIRKRIKELEK